MKIANVVDSQLMLTWGQYDNAWVGGKKQIEYCADGDGLIVVRQTKEGLKLFDQGVFVRSFDGSLIDALRAAERHMIDHGYGELFPEIGVKNSPKG